MHERFGVCVCVCVGGGGFLALPWINTCLF